MATLNETFTNIANAIRAKGVEGQMTPLEMPDKIATIPQGGGDEWKDLLIKIADNTLTGKVTLPVEIVTNRDFFITSQPNMTELEYLADTMPKRPYYACTNLHTLYALNLKTTPNSFFNSANSLIHIYLDAVTAFDNVSFYPVITGIMRNIHILTKTCDEVKAIRNFPGLTKNYGGNYEYLRFECSDGWLVYNGTEWVKTQI